MEALNCRNCNTTVDTKFCGHCGQAVQLKRVDRHYVIHEIEHVLHFEKGILYTVKELLIRPGKNIKEFITDNRSRLVKPVIFIIVTSLIYTVINHFFHLEEQYINYQGNESSATTSIFKWIQGHYGYANMIMGVFISLWLKLFFRKHDYNFFEILILLCFVMGTGMLILAIFALIQGVTKIDLFSVSGISSIVYCIWAIGNFFDKRKVSSYLRGLAAYLLGIITFLIATVLLGFLIDAIKH